MSDSTRYTPPYYESYDEISFNMEIPGGKSRPHLTSPSRIDPRLSSLEARRAFEHRPIRGFRQSTPEEEAYNRRKFHSTPKVPSYTEALLASSRRNRFRAMSPPIIIDEPTPRINLRFRASSIDRKLPLAGPSTISSNSYRKSVRSIYDRQPLFQDFLHERPGENQSFDIYRMKSDFRGMLSDKYKKMTFNDPAVEHNIGRKLLPWKDQLKREEPASKRILQEQKSLRTRVSLSPVPRLTVYHRSTTPRLY